MQIQRINNQQNQNFEANIQFKRVVNEGEYLVRKLSRAQKAELRKQAARIGNLDNIIVSMDMFTTTQPVSVARELELRQEAVGVKIDTVIGKHSDSHDLKIVKNVEPGQSILAYESPFETISKFLNNLSHLDKQQAK